VVVRVLVDCQPGDSLEAEARRLRHAALHDMAVAEGVAEIWLAHHQRDQAETFVLQALRGAGIKGLAAMPQAQARAGVNWVRPWLQVPATEVAAYVQRHGLPHIEDESNHDTRWARNHLRHAVWPGLRAHFGGVDARLADAASHVADALPVMEAWAQAQLSAEGMLGSNWPVAGWCARPANERRLLLAAWYRRASGRSLPASWVSRLAREWPALHVQSRPWQDEGLGLSLYRGQVAWQAMVGRSGGRASRLDAAPVVRASSMVGSPVPFGAGPAAQALASSGAIDLSVFAPGRYALPAFGGVLHVSEVAAGGLPAAPGVVWQLRCREGGERWQAYADGPARSLKKQWQAAGVPPWARRGPLVWRGDALLWVPGLGVDARCQAESGAPQWALTFEPDAA